MYKLMIVDDEPLERQVIKEFVKQNKSINIIKEACDGKEAIKKAYVEKPDIIFMDIKLPEMNGIKASTVIKESLPYTKIVIISAYDDFSYIQEAFKFGAKNFLLKPVQKKELLKLVEQLVIELDKERVDMNEEEHFSELLEEMKPYIKQGFALELFDNKIASIKELEEKANYLGIKELPELTMIVDIDNYQNLTAKKKRNSKTVFKAESFKNY